MSKNNDVGKVLDIVSEDDFTEVVLKSLTPVFVDFWAPECIPCRMQTPIMNDCAIELGAQAVVARVNVDLLPGIAEQLNIVGIPTITVYQDGCEIKRFVGIQAKKTLLDFLNN